MRRVKASEVHITALVNNQTAATSEFVIDEGLKRLVEIVPWITIKHTLTHK